MTELEAVALVEQLLSKYRVFRDYPSLASRIYLAFKKTNVPIGIGNGRGLIEIVRAACSAPGRRPEPGNHVAATVIVSALVENGRLRVTGH